MKNLIAAVALSLFLAPAAYAAETPAKQNVYGFVNFTDVMRKCDAGVAIKNELDAKGKQFQAELSKEEQNLNAARREFEKSRGGLSQADAEKKVREIEAKYAQADKLLQERRHTLNMAEKSALVKLKKEALDVIVAVSKERGFTALFSQEAVILAAEEYDITDEVVKRLNAKVKKVAIDWSGKAPAATGKN